MVPSRAGDAWRTRKSAHAARRRRYRWGDHTEDDPPVSRMARGSVDRWPRRLSVQPSRLRRHATFQGAATTGIPSRFS